MAVSFPAASAALKRTSGILPCTGDFTVCAWVWFTGTATNYRLFVESFDAGAVGYFFLGTDATGLVLEFDAYNLSTGAGYVGPGLPNNIWQHVALTYNSTTHVFTIYLNGVALATRTVDMSGVTLTQTYLADDGLGTGFAGNATAYYREWTAVLTQPEIAAEMASGVAVRTADLFTSTPLNATINYADYSGNSHTWTPVGSPQTSVPPFVVAPTPASPRSVALPLTDPVDLSGATPGLYYWNGSNGTAYNVGWWTYTPPSGVTFIYIAAGPTAGADAAFRPETQVWVERLPGVLVNDVIAPAQDALNFWGQNYGVLGGGWFRVPVTPGTPIWVSVTQYASAGAPVVSGALATTQIQDSPKITAPAGALVVSDDSDGFPAAVFDGATGTFYQFRSFPAGEFTAMQPNGKICTQNGDTDTSVAFLDAAWAVVATWDTPSGWGVSGVKTDLNGHFYVALRQFNLASPPTRVYIFTEDGALLSQHNLPSDFDKTSIYAVSRDGVKWFAALQGTASPIHVYDLQTDTQLADLTIASANNFTSPRSGYTANDGSILFAKNVTRVDRYDPSTGALLQSYTPVVITRINEFAYTNVGAEAIAIWGYTGGADLNARFEIFLLDGTHVSTSPAVQVAGGSEENQGGTDPNAISNSCPIWFTTIALPAGDTGTLIVTKTTLPSPDPDVTGFPFVAGGGLMPSSFTLRDGDTRTFTFVPVGDGYSIAEAVQPGWVVAYVVSNGSPPSNIAIGTDETVTVAVTNTRQATARYHTRRLRQFAMPFDRSLWVFIRRVEFLVQSGVGLSLPTAQGWNPVLQVRFSGNGGRTWGKWIQVPLGKIGRYNQRAVISGVGQMRNGLCQVVMSDPVVGYLLDCLVDADENTT